MRTSKPIILYLPDLLVNELDKYLKERPPNFKTHKIYFYYVIHYLIILQIQHKKEEHHTLNKKYLRSVTECNIDRYIKILKDGEFIICDGKFEPGVKSLKYKVNPKYLEGLTKFEIESGSKIHSKIIRKQRQKRAHHNRLEPHLKAMKNEFMNMDMDYQSAHKWAKNNANDSQKLSYLTSLNHIEDKRFRYFQRNKTNRRLDTNLTNLKSDLRQFIIGDYVSIDLKNSQPFLLGILIDTIINNRDTLCCYLSMGNILKAFGVKGIKNILLIHQNQEKAEMVKFRNYYNSVLNGTLYDEFISEYSGHITRKEVKEIMFKVLFSRNQFYQGYKKIIPYENDKEAFAEVYPFVYEVVKELKVKDHKTLPIFLQRLESYLFIDCIAKELVRKGIVPFTIHDSVIVKAEYQHKTIEIMNNVFLDQLGVIPSFDIEYLNKVDNPIIAHDYTNNYKYELI
jgi:hypothetical protein